MYDYKSVDELRRDALSGNAQAIEEVTKLYNDVFHCDDPNYPKDEAPAEVTLGRVEGKSEDEKRQESYDNMMITIDCVASGRSPTE